MLKMMKIVLLLVAVCFVFAQALPSPGSYWDNGYNRPGQFGPFYMGPYCSYKCSMKCWRMGMVGVCDNYMCMCQQGIGGFPGGQ